MTPKSVAFYTLGCKLNYAETSSIGRLFEKGGYEVVNFEHGADVYVINTCSVTDFADRKCRKVVRQALRLRPGAAIVVMGCYAQLKPEEIAAIPGVDLVLGAGEKFRVLEYVEGLEKLGERGMVHAGEVQEVQNFVGAFSFGDRTRSFLKVQDGCDYRCSFCTIPMARGASRSPSIESIVQQANEIATMGIREIVLTGVNIGDFGKGKPETFLDLIQALDEIEGIERFRISSIEPNLLSNAIIDFVGSSKRFVPHFHIPLQSGNNRQLQMMRRRYRRELYANRVARIRSVMPDCCIGVDVIVGFPGETAEDFAETCRFIESLDISYLHVFTYSERANTVATTMEAIVPMQERRRRNEILRKLSEKKRQIFYSKFIGTQRPVLLERSKQSGWLTGFTDNYVKVRIAATETQLNSIALVELSRINSDGTVSAIICSKQLPVIGAHE